MDLRLSVKQKLILSLWLTSLLLLVMAGSVASTWFVHDQATRLDDFLSREVRGVQDTLQTYFSVNGGEGPLIDSFDSPDFQDFLRTYFQERLNRPVPYKTTLGIFGLQGQLIRSSNNALPLVPVNQSWARDLSLATIEGPPTYRLASVEVRHNGQALGTIRLACLTVTLGEVWNSFLVSLTLVLGLIFVSFGLLGMLLIHWSLLPVRQMTRSAQDISESHLDLRLTVPTGRDEISDLARTLNGLLARLERDFEFEEALVGQLSHELRTPLAILRGRNEVAIEHLGPAGPSVRAILEDNLADIDNLVALLNTLLSLARLDGRMTPLRQVPVDLAAILQDLLEELDPMWQEKELDFLLSLPGGTTTWAEAPTLMVRGDPVLLRQVFLNILTNAYKYAPRRSLIHLSVERGGPKARPVWQIQFHNFGPAIPEESLELVFKRFYRVEVQDPGRFEREAGLGQKGFGLGLSIAKTLVELHNGAIRAQNPESGGAAFVVELPCEVTKALP